jgi:hypothetical protein
MIRIEVRRVSKFPEPEFSRLQRVVFEGVQQPSDVLAEIIKAEAANLPVVPREHSPMFRVGAYAGAELVGWSCGWMERGNVFYTANSGVVAHYRRRGIYTSLLCAIREHAESQGAVAIRSQHSVLNNAVIIAKLRAGFIVSGISQSAQMGTLVELTFHLSEKRQELYKVRSLAYVVAEA